MTAIGRRTVVVGFIAALVSAGCDSETSTTAPPAAEPTKGSSEMKLSSTAFKDGGAIPKKHSGEGDDLSPPLAWQDPPEGTRTFALVCDDPDAPSPEPWVHWVIFNISADVRSLPEGVESAQSAINKPTDAQQGKNSWTSGVLVGYRGPMPPPGHGTHHYHFKLYALDSKLELPSPPTKAQLLKAMQGHILAEAELVGTYER